MADTDVVTKGPLSALVTAISSKINALLAKSLTLAPSTVEGFWLKLVLNAYANPSTDAEPLIVYGYRGTSNYRAFWLNENGSPRCAAINSEPALKVFGPAYDSAYTGQVFQVLSRWNGTKSQIHLFGVNAAGNPVVGSGQTVGAFTIVLGAAETVPTGLPTGTVIVRRPT